jgi:hypothetical protein
VFGVVDTSDVFKRPVNCSRCNEPFYFTLASIAQKQVLICPECRSEIDLGASGYRRLVADVRDVIAEIGQVDFPCTENAKVEVEAEMRQRAKSRGMIAIFGGDLMPRVRNNLTEVAAIVVGFILSVVAIQMIAQSI